MIPCVKITILCIRFFSGPLAPLMNKRYEHRRYPVLADDMTGFSVQLKSLVRGFLNLEKRTYMNNNDANDIDCVITLT